MVVNGGRSPVHFACVGGFWERRPGFWPVRGVSYCGSNSCSA